MTVGQSHLDARSTPGAEEKGRAQANAASGKAALPGAIRNVDSLAARLTLWRPAHSDEARDAHPLDQAAADGDAGPSASRLDPAAADEPAGVRMEPHAAPALAPAQQVANAILEAAPHPEADSSIPGATRRMAQPVSYLHVVLEPPGLGSVSVRLHVSDQRLHIEMQVKEPRTRALIEADTSLIVGSLSDGGCDVERITVTTASPDAPQSSSQFFDPSTPGDRAPQSGGERQGHSSRRQRASDGHHRTADDIEADRASPRLGADDRYI